ncbi:unnamed protein product [Zymoseptoria tritici ST99CH_1E4]|uniref:Extracellular membrane protein CFEM domain-containing protein n=1 Tax=Zymoseptoria tritici ST99CH_1E4 TaxID=1276532 RepID=A0A2H1FK29_ZYMTR|nr:unnamed protein product [Zymoseptoria tritici ST99CH_1E4]
MHLKNYLLVAAATVLGAVDARARVRCESALTPDATMRTVCWPNGGYTDLNDGRNCCIGDGHIGDFFKKCAAQKHGKIVGIQPNTCP